MVPERTFVNFITLAESVVLPPMEDFRISSVGFSACEVDVFNLLLLVIPNGLLPLWTSSCVIRVEVTLDEMISISLIDIVNQT